MTILYLHQYFKFPSESGGTRSYDLASYIVKSGYKVVVITSTSNKKFYNKKRWNIIEKEGIIVHYIYIPYSNNFSYSKRSFVFLKFLFFSTIHLLKQKGDLLIATSTPLTIGIPALFKKWIHSTPFIFEVRDVWPETVIAIGAIKNKLIQRLLFYLEKTMYKNASYIVPLSTDMKDSIQRRFMQFKEKTEVVIENISEITRFNSTGTTPVNINNIIGFKPRFTVLYAGTFGKVNGIHKFIELAEKTISIDNSLIYILIGSGVAKEEVISLAKNKNVLNKNVFIMNPINKEELPYWYAAASMGSSFVIDIPQLWANSANKFFDTLAASRPILINHKGWQADIINKYNCGFVLESEITESSALDFVNYTKDIDLINIQSKNALSLATEKYSLNIAGEKYITLINNILKREKHV